MPIKEITPSSLKCGVGCCPVVFRQGKDLLIIGKIVKEIPESVREKIGSDEQVILVPEELVQDLEVEDLE